MTLKIGIPAQNHDDKFGVNINYLEFIYQFGHPIIINPIEKEDFLSVYKIDALVLPGGADVDSKRYARMPSLANYAPNIHLEHFDKEILPLLVGNMPIFGICRGLQTLNVYFKGTLRNLIWHPYSSSEMDKVHNIFYYKNGIRPLFDKKKSEHDGVNSFHHQAIDKLADNFQIEAESEYGNIVEAISDYKKGIFAVQWHPERLLDNYSRNMFLSILRG
jgi:putative glutamine amidotransferase